MVKQWIPNSSDCIRMLHENCVPESVIAHSKTVSRIAILYGNAIEVNGYDINMPVLKAGALLHDIGKSKYKSFKHASYGAKILKKGGIHEWICSCVENHIAVKKDIIIAEEHYLPPDPMEEKDYIPRPKFPNKEKSCHPEEQIICYADKLTKGASIVELLEYMEKRERGNVKFYYGHLEPFMIELYNDMSKYLGERGKKYLTVKKLRKEKEENNKKEKIDFSIPKIKR